MHPRKSPGLELAAAALAPLRACALRWILSRPHTRVRTFGHLDDGTLAILHDARVEVVRHAPACACAVQAADSDGLLIDLSAVVVGIPELQLTELRRCLRFGARVALIRPEWSTAESQAPGAILPPLLAHVANVLALESGCVIPQLRGAGFRIEERERVRWSVSFAEVDARLDLASDRWRASSIGPGNEIVARWTRLAAEQRRLPVDVDVVLAVGELLPISD